MTTTTASPKLYRTLIDVPVVHAAAEADRQAFLDWAENEGIGHDRLVSVAFTDDRTSALVTRYDLKDSGTEIDLEETSFTITTASDMTLQAVEDVLLQKATKRNLSLKIFDFQTPEPVGGNRLKQVVKLRKGLSQELAKQLSKTVRDELKKVTVAIQGDTLRITGKSKDDLQAAINLLPTACLYFPGLIHAIVLLNAHYADKRTDRIVKAMKGQRAK